MRARRSGWRVVGTALSAALVGVVGACSESVGPDQPSEFEALGPFMNSTGAGCPCSPLTQQQEFDVSDVMAPRCFKWVCESGASRA